MSKLKKCLYLINLLERKGALTLKEINDYYQYSSLYDGDEIQPRTFLRYKDYIDETFPCYIEFNNKTDKYELEIIRIKVYGSQVEYVRALPIHESQKEIETTEEWSIFEYRVVPCYNLYQQLLWHREKLEVLSPQYVRDEIKASIQKMLEYY